MKLKNTLFCLLCAAATLLLIPTCKTADNTTAFIDQPFKGVDVPLSARPVDASTGGSLHFDNGTNIVVPANAFVDEEGKPVQGKVDLQYREFHTAGDIITSGIPMIYDDGKEKIQFQSAGMFELNASAENGKQVNIAPGKTLTVNMASFRKGDDFSFYYLDKGSKNWKTMGTAAATENPVKKEKMAKLIVLPSKPAEPKEYDGKSPVFDLDVDYERYPELAAFDGVIWQYAGDGSSGDPSKEPGVFKKNWTSISLLPGNAETMQYTLVLKNDKSSFNSVVTPVLKGKNYEKARKLFQSKMAAYQEIALERQQEEARLQAEGDLIRSFNVGQFGIYNWDKQYKDDNVIRLAANFKVDGKNTDMSKINVYLLAGDEKTVIRYPSYDWERFSFNPEVPNKLVAVLPGNKIAVFSDAQFKGIGTGLRNQANPAYTFVLKVQPGEIASAKQLDQTIASF